MHGHKHQYWRKAAFWCACALTLFGAGEAGYRTLGYWKNGTHQAMHEYDAELGWRATSNYRGKPVRMRDKLGREYQRSMQTDVRGSRLWGSRAGAPRLLFLGDSFTSAIEVSNDKTYGAVFAQRSNFDVYCYGSGAYGTLQEAIMLERLLHELKPDVLVLQFSLNDFTNNSLGLERQTILFQQTVRPYLVGGAVEHRFAVTHPYRLALRYSRLFARIDATIGVLLYSYYGGYNRLPPGPELDALERHGVEVSEQLLRRIAAVVPAGTRLYAFNRDESKQESNRLFEEISARAGFRVMRNIASWVDAHESPAETTLSADGIHFNEHGNRLLGEQLAHYFSGRGDGPDQGR